MTLKKFQVQAQERIIDRKSDNKKLRKQGLVPAAIFFHKGKDSWVRMISLPLKEMEKIGFSYNIPVEIQVGSETFLTCMKEAQIHPITQQLLHIDFMMVGENEIITSLVPLNFKPLEEKSAKVGLVVKHRRSLKIRGHFSEIPNEISVDTDLELSLGSIIRLSDLSIPDSVKVVDFAPHSPLATLVKA